jgi:hypothetical protein
VGEKEGKNYSTCVISGIAGRYPESFARESRKSGGRPAFDLHYENLQILAIGSSHFFCLVRILAAAQ